MCATNALRPRSSEAAHPPARPLALQASVAQLRAPVPKLVAIRESRLKKVNGC